MMVSKNLIPTCHTLIFEPLYRLQEPFKTPEGSAEPENPPTLQQMYHSIKALVSCRISPLESAEWFSNPMNLYIIECLRPT